MKLEELADLKRQGKYDEIVNWAEEAEIEQIDDVNMLLFAAEAYEKKGFVQKCEMAYQKAMNNFDEELAAEGLLKLYKNTDNADKLKKLAEELEEKGFPDEFVLLAGFEEQRAKDASKTEQIAALKEYMEEYYNDELYHILLLELLLENGDAEGVKRYLNKYHRMFPNSDYEETYIIQIEKLFEQGKFIRPEKTIRNIIYQKIEKKDEVKQDQTEQKAVTGPSEKNNVRIKTRSLQELISGKLFQDIIKKEKPLNEEPPTMEERFQNIVGMKEVRDKVGSVYRVFKMQQERKSSGYNSEMLAFTHFVIDGKRGYGKRLLAETIGKMLVDFSIRGQEEAIGIQAKDFCDNYDNLNQLDDTTLIIENIDRCMDNNGKFGDFAWSLRRFLLEHKNDLSVIMTGSKEAVVNLFREEPDIGNAVYPPNDSFSIPDYTPDELMQILELLARQEGFLLTQQAKELVKKQIEKECKMSTFAGGDSLMEKLILAQRKAADRFEALEEIEESNQVMLEESDFTKEGIELSAKELIQKLDAMIGLQSVKQQVNKLVSNIIFEKEAEKSGVEKTTSAQPLHMIFKGEPGTGKTTVARLIGEIYQSLGVLPGNKEGMIECSAPDLIGMYVGETALKTQKVIDRAMGSVLFVDEAYSLMQNQFGKEAITTLLKAMEDNRDSIMIILAGYEEDIDKLLDTNAGLRSRMPTEIYFENYSEEELLLIFRNIVSEDHRFLEKDTKEVLQELIHQASKAQDFGNARGVRNLVGLVEAAMKERVVDMVRAGEEIPQNAYEIIRREDIEKVMASAGEGQKSLEELLDELNQMEGMEQLKAVVNKQSNTVRAYEMKKKFGVQDELQIDSMHMVFSGGPGTGKTTMARKIGLIYKALGILPRGDNVLECDAKDLIGQYIGQTAPIVAEKIKHSMGGVLFIDEAYQLSRGNGNNSFGQEAIDALVKAMEDKRDKFMVILAGYTNEMNEFLDKNPGLRSRIPNIIEFPDYSTEQMTSIFRKMADEKGYQIESGAERTLLHLIEEKSQQKDFGNARGVRNVLAQVLYAVDERIVNTSDNLSAENCKTIMTIDLEKLMNMPLEKKDVASVDELLKELDSMVGLDRVKKAVRRIVDEAQYNIWAESQGIGQKGDHGSLHMLFKGNAGTGKTTVARMIGNIYRAMGVLRTGQLVECSRKELVAGYVGQTAAKTQQYIDSALGGILFVDEAYELYKGGGNDFGMEALTTIMKAMEDHRDDMMVIFAGYSKEIDNLIAANQGLESRFSKQNEIIFDDYEMEELSQIFLFQAKKKGLIVEEKLYPVILDTIEKVKRESDNFGNARGVRNIVEAVDRARKHRITQLLMRGETPDTETALILTEADFEEI